MAEKNGLRYLNCFTMNNCKIANELRKYRDLANSINQVSLSGEKYQKPADCVDYAEYIITRELTNLDMVVANAAYTVMTAAPDDSFQAETIARVMAGNPERRITAKKRLELEQCLQKLSRTRIHILADHDHQVEQDLYEGDFLPITWEGEDGRLRFRFRRGETMPLYQYAEHHRQLLQVPFAWLRDDDGEQLRHNNNDRMLLLRHFLLQELEVIRYPGNRVTERKLRLLKRDREGQEMGLLWMLGLSETGEETVARKVQTLLGQLLENWQKSGCLEAMQYQMLPPEEGFGVRLTCIRSDQKLQDKDADA